MARKRRNQRNLWKRDGIWQVEAIVGGRRIKRSLKTRLLEVAIERRDVVLREALAAFDRPDVPTFAEAAADALRRMEARREAGSEDALATTTATARRNALAAKGPILPHLGRLRLDAIDAPSLWRWWEREITEAKRAPKSGRNYLDAIEMVLREARASGHLDRHHKPVQEFREGLSLRRRTKNARAAKDTKRRLAKARRLTPEEFGRLTEAAREDRSPETYLVVLLAGEHGLRHGEISGLRWGDIAIGDGPEDPTRHLFLQRSLSSGLEPGPLKGGRARKAPLSRRLAEALLDVRRARFSPSPDALIIETGYFELERRLVRRACTAAGIGKRTLQNLRATASSLLKQWGVPTKLVGVAIGHESEAVAEEHYDAIDVTEARPAETWDRIRGENFADLFARLCPEPKSHQKSHHQSHKTPKRLTESQGFRVVTGGANSSLNGLPASSGRLPRPPATEPAAAAPAPSA